MIGLNSRPAMSLIRRARLRSQWTCRAGCLMMVSYGSFPGRSLALRSPLHHRCGARKPRVGWANHDATKRRNHPGPPLGSARPIQLHVLESQKLSGGRPIRRLSAAAVFLAISTRGDQSDRNLDFGDTFIMSRVRPSDVGRFNGKFK